MVNNVHDFAFPAQHSLLPTPPLVNAPQTTGWQASWAWLGLAGIHTGRAPVPPTGGEENGQ